MKEKQGTLKWKVLLIIIGIVAIVAIAIGAVFFLSKEEAYRSIAVNQLEGTTLIKSEHDEKQAYKGMHLNSGDEVEVLDKSNLTLLMDANKYLYAEAGTQFEVECVGGEKSGKKVIHLKEGSVLIRLKTALKDGETYEVETPRATMSVRGTVFRISVEKDTEDIVHTGIQVFDGKVQVDLQNESGESVGVCENFVAGEEGAIVGDKEVPEFEKGENGAVKQEINYKELPKDVAEVLVDYIDDGEELSIEKELLMDYTNLTEHKMETREGKEATCTEDGYAEVWCTICNEVSETVTIPATGHTMGEWATVKEPTCVDVGKKQRSCTICNTYTEEEEIPALGHKAGEMQVISEATCTDAGLSQQICTVCKAVVNRADTQALGHNYGSWSESSAPTCTRTGVESRTCSVCNVTENREIAALGHILSGSHTHENLVMEGNDYVSCTCVTTCTRAGCGQTVSVAATVRSSVLGVMVQYFCNNCGNQI